ncbi:hypothetical protein FGRMN_11241 [Fusarium graminum]|nr:hypothetical protein FGRMN_11241 [Fusarium graminum]
MGQEQSQPAPGAWPNEANVRKATLPTQERALIAVCGMTGSGKSTFIQRVTGQNVKVGHNLLSETSSVQEVHFIADQHPVTLVDTPGFDDTELSDTEVLTILTNWLQTSYIEGTRLCGLIYMHPITQVRMGNTSARNLKLFRKLCGDGNLGNVLLVTNKWEICEEKIAEKRFEELTTGKGFWKVLLQYGASAHRYHNQTGQAMDLIRKLMAKQPIALNVQRQLVDEQKSLLDTDVGNVVHEDLLQLERQNLREMESLKQKLKESQQRGNQELRNQLKRQQAEADRELDEVRRTKAMLMAQVVKLQSQQEESERAIQAITSKGEQERQVHALQMAALRRDELESRRIENQRREAERQRQDQANMRQRWEQQAAMQQLVGNMQRSTLQPPQPQRPQPSMFRGPILSFRCFRCMATFEGDNWPPLPFDFICLQCSQSLVVQRLDPVTYTGPGSYKVL